MRSSDDRLAYRACCN